MRTALICLFATLALLLAACGNGDSGDGDGDGGTGYGATDSDLDDGTAAIVNGEEISAERVEEQLSSVAESDPSIAEQLEGEQGEQAAGQFKAQVLSMLIHTRIILDGAEELGVAPTEEDIEQARAGLMEEAGGEEAFAAAVSRAGLTEEGVEEQLRSVAALDNVEQELLDSGAAEELPETPEGADPGEVVLQQWLAERLAQAEVEVHPDFGTWDGEAGQVMAPGQEAPAPAPTP